MKNDDYLHQYVQYIRNTGQIPLRVDWFDEDWDPIGPMVRFDLFKLGWITLDDGGIRLTDKAPKEK